ncbi:MAG: tRNA (adenosine(37)-N6)-threonylcarbamoyltransferase complex ATPase subunit type 1 TsaE [Candidatus Brocadiia bacterium]
MKHELPVLETSLPEETKRLAAIFATLCQPGDVVGLQGSLGAGKTCFVKGMARGLAVPDERIVTSPTFVLLKRYKGSTTLHHFDAYRLSGASEMESIGCYEIFEGDGVSVIEWADHVAECLPVEHFLWDIRVKGKQKRRFQLEAAGEGPVSRLPKISESLTEWRNGSSEIDS